LRLRTRSEEKKVGNHGLPQRPRCKGKSECRPIEQRGKGGRQVSNEPESNAGKNAISGDTRIPVTGVGRQDMRGSKMEAGRYR